MELVLQVYRQESQRKTLAPLQGDFWEKVQDYVRGLEEDLRKESARDSNSAKAALLRDELKKVLKRREQIYQYRERKIVLLASSAASGASVETENLTPLEKQSFEDLLRVLERGRGRALGGEEVKEEPSPGEMAATGKPPRKPQGAKAPRLVKEKVIVRILEDIPPFLGLDVTYRLRKEDVIGLPEEVASLLIGKGKAEKITPKL